MNNLIPTPGINPGKYVFKSFAFLLLLCLMHSPVRAQETKVVRDLHLWTGVKLEKSFAKDWTISLREEVRFKHDISELNNYFTDLELAYSISKNFSLEGNYRFTRDRKKDLSYENLSRYNFDLSYKGKLDFLTIKYRLRYQKEVEGFNLFAQEIPFEKYLRHRITLRYNDLKDLEPFVSGELFQLFRPVSYPMYEYIRLQAGIIYEMKNAGEIKAAFGVNRELVSTHPALIYMLRLHYTFKL